MQCEVCVNNNNNRREQEQLIKQRVQLKYDKIYKLVWVESYKINMYDL